MKIIVLGSGAAGATRPAAGPGVPPRTQDAIAVSDDGRTWVLVNASPDIGEQLRRTQALRPTGGPAAPPVRGVILTDAQLDHVGGLLALCDGPRLELFATPGVYEDLTTSLPLVNVLQSYCGVRWHMLPVAGDQRRADFQVDGLPGLRFTALDVPGRVPPHSARRAEASVGDTVALLIEDLRDGTRVFCAPSLDAVGDGELSWMRSADCLMVGRGAPAPDAADLIDALAATAARRKVLVRVDAADPGLADGSATRRLLDACGIELAYDGMEIEP